MMHPPVGGRRSEADSSRGMLRVTTARPGLSTGTARLHPGFSTVSTDFGLSSRASGAGRGDLFGGRTRRSLTCRTGGRYNRQACARTSAGARNGVSNEAHVPTQQPEARQDARFPQADVHEGRSRDSRGAPQEGSQGPRAECRLGPSARQVAGADEAHDHSARGD